MICFPKLQAFWDLPGSDLVNHDDRDNQRSTLLSNFYKMENSYKHSEITNLIIKSFFTVYNTLGFGFLEKVYERSMIVEMKKMGLTCISQFPIDVFYDLENVGYYQADIIVNNCIILEIKSARSICDEHEAQLTNYLKASNIEVGLLLNFGQKPEVRRKVFSCDFKKTKINSTEK